MIYYKCSIITGEIKLEKVEAQSASISMVNINGKNHWKCGKYDRYTDSSYEAIMWAISEFEKEVRDAQTKLDHVKEKLKKAEEFLKKYKEILSE